MPLLPPGASETSFLVLFETETPPWALSPYGLRDNCLLYSAAFSWILGKS